MPRMIDNIGSNGSVKADDYFKGLSEYGMLDQDRGFNDVESIKTEQLKLSSREQNLLENHLYSHSQTS